MEPNLFLQVLDHSCFENFINSMERFFTYFSIKFDNLYLKWNFLRIWLRKWKKWVLFYERSSSKIILIENTKLFFFCCVYIYNLSNKKCVYIIKKRAYVYIHVRGSCLNKYISIALGPQKKIPSYAPGCKCILFRYRLRLLVHSSCIYPSK